MLSKAYADGFKDGLDSAVVNAPTIPYCGDGWNSITNYSTTATNSMTIDTSKSPSGICVGSDLEVPTITLANSVTAVKASN
jgi:hypothetical protein